MSNPELLNGSNLAFIGDAYYELSIRKYLIDKGITNQNELHKHCVKYVSAYGHHLIMQEIRKYLTEEELNIFKRGRNFKNKSRRINLKRIDYLESTGFEAVIGYLYLKNNFQRLDELIDKSIHIIEEFYQNA